MSIIQNICSLFFSSLALVSVASAQDVFPSKAIRVVVPYPPGASTDGLARAFAQELAKELKVNVIVENKPGGGTTIGALAVKNAPADGYTLLFQVDGLYNGKLATPTVAYEMSDFEILSSLGQTPYALVVPSKINANNLDELKAYADSRKGELTFGVLGNGVTSYSILATNLSKALNVTPRLIPYKGGVEGVVAAMAGDIDAYFATVSLAYAQKDNVKIKLLGITSDSGKNRFLPNVKSFEDLGIKHMNLKSLYGIAIRANTAPVIKSKLIKSIANVIETEDMKKARTTISLEEFSGSLVDYKAEVMRNLQMYENAQLMIAK
jgi:tripartite-type tricarboxylate transporter receptor subunit TctC